MKLTLRTRHIRLTPKANVDLSTLSTGEILR